MMCIVKIDFHAISNVQCTVLKKRRGPHRTLQRYFKRLMYCSKKEKGSTSNIPKVLRTFNVLF